MGKNTLDEWMTRRKEVDAFILHGFFAVECPHVARSRRHTRQPINQRSVAEFDREHPVTARMRDGEAQTDRCRDDHLLVELVELFRDARENAGPHLRPVRIAVELLVRGFADARARLVRFGDEGAEALV